MAAQTYGIAFADEVAQINSDRSKYGHSGSIQTFVPYLGMILKGDHSNSPFNMDEPNLYYASQSLATYKMPNSNNLRFGVKVDSEQGGFTAATAENDYRGGEPQIEFVASLKKDLWIANKEQEEKTNFIQNGGFVQNGQNLPPYIAAQVFSASVPPGQVNTDSASQVVGPLTQIPFIQDVLGFPNPQYWINELTTKVALPQLHAEQPETDWGTPNLQLEPTQFVENRRPDFDSHFFLAKRNEFAFIIPREYRYRATIDPYNIYVRQASDGLRQAREALTLLALSDLPDQATDDSFVNSGGNIPDPQADNSGGYPAADVNAKAFYESLFAEFWLKTRGEIDSIVMNPVDFVNYESNFYTNGWTGYKDVSNWGLIQFPGFARSIRCAISPFCPRGIAYFFNSRFVYTGEGPMVTESWAKPEANSDAGAYRDYVDITIFNTKRAGFKGLIIGSASDLSSFSNSGDIQTLTEARNLIKPPAGLLEKDRTS